MGTVCHQLVLTVGFERKLEAYMKEPHTASQDVGGLARIELCPDSRSTFMKPDLPGGVFTCDSTDTPEGAIECASSSSMLFSDDVFADDCSASSAN